MAFLAPLVPFLPAIAAGLGLATALVVTNNRPKTPALPPPVKPPSPPIRMSQTAAQQRATLLARPTGGGAGLAAATVGAGTSPAGPMTRPTLLGR